MTQQEREGERERGEGLKKETEEGGGGDEGMLGTKCSNPKPTSQRVTQGFHIVSVLGRGPASWCDPAERRRRSDAFVREQNRRVCLP